MIIYKVITNIIVLERQSSMAISPYKIVFTGWLASTYQCDSEPRDYQECSQVHEPRVRGCRFLGIAYQSPNSVGTFNPLITQLSSVLRSLKPTSSL
ncbi:hypothetical protein AVEN_212294-1 [Araneus ventricosus]|uniref:Uncharacterized protein n=1 Tax=Araneus ventricosus TaxID=182803 RepID=A0A4Y2LKX7_ARAVE|nr:hypothetical protein AVEN_212294-1 [Araneus ventricosus]